MIWRLFWVIWSHDLGAIKLNCSSFSEKLGKEEGCLMHTVLAVSFIRVGASHIKCGRWILTSFLTGSETHFSATYKQMLLSFWLRILWQKQLAKNYVWTEPKWLPSPYDSWDRPSWPWLQEQVFIKKWIDGCFWVVLLRRYNSTKYLQISFAFLQICLNYLLLIESIQYFLFHNNCLYSLCENVTIEAFFTQRLKLDNDIPVTC